MLLATRFKSLVVDPVAELTGGLPYLALLQVIFAVVCLPAAGSSSGTATGAGTGTGTATGVAAAAAAAPGATGAGSGTEGTDEERKKVGLGRSVRSAARRRAQHGKHEGVWVRVVVSFPLPCFQALINVKDD